MNTGGNVYFKTLWKNVESTFGKTWNLKVTISKISILTSLVTPVAVSSNCRCVFGPHFPERYLYEVCHWIGNICGDLERYAASTTNELKTVTLAPPALFGEPTSATPLRFFSPKISPPRTTHNSQYWKCKGFHQQAIGLITTTSFSNRLDLDENLRDYYFNINKAVISF